MASYKTTTFSSLTEKRKAKVRAEIVKGHKAGLDAATIAKKVRISPRSVATALGNITRQG